MHVVPTSTLLVIWDAWTALHFLIDRQLPGVVEIVIKHGANINIQDAEGFTYLHFALDRKLPDVLRTFHQT